MLKIKKTKIDMDKTIKNKVDFSLRSISLKPKYICGNLVKLSNTNLTYVEPHKAVLDNFMILFFNYSDQVYVNNLMNKMNLEDIYDYIKLKKYENDFDF